MTNSQGDRLLEEIYKSAKMGMQATKLVSEKTENHHQRSVIDQQHSVYHRIAESAGERLAKKGALPGENNILDQATLWGSIQMNTLTGATPTKISEIMINGCNMGIVEMRKKMNDCSDADDFTRKLGTDFIEHSEHHMNDMKEYL